MRLGIDWAACSPRAALMLDGALILIFPSGERSPEGRDQAHGGGERLSVGPNTVGVLRALKVEADRLLGARGPATIATIAVPAGCEPGERAEVARAAAAAGFGSVEFIDEWVAHDVGRPLLQGNAPEFAVCTGAAVADAPSPEAARPVREETIPLAADAAMLAELEYWKTIRGSTQPEYYEAFLRAFPSGRFAQLAQLKLMEIARAERQSPAVASSRTAAIRESLGWGVWLDIVAIPAGEFRMGTSQAEAMQVRRALQRVGPSTVLKWVREEMPQHRVVVSEYLLGAYPVTQEQWAAVAAMSRVERDLDPNPSQFEGRGLPVERISWEEAAEFCARLSRHSGRAYRLPTEAEWEHACRAGAATAFHFGDTIATDLANYNGNDKYGDGVRGLARDRTVAVGSLGGANAFGVWDAHGNVWEWCLDWYDRGYYEHSPSVDPRGPESGTARVRRGGSWKSLPCFCRSASRSSAAPVTRNGETGFRVAASPVTGSR